jgi:hypothetical protein
MQSCRWVYTPSTIYLFCAYIGRKDSEYALEMTKRVQIIQLKLINYINRKLRVATKIESTFFWFLTSYRAAENVQNDYLSSA